MIRIEPVTPEHMPGIWTAYSLIVQERLYFSADEPIDLDSFERWMTAEKGPYGVQLAAVLDDLVLGWCAIQQGSMACMHHAGTVFMGLRSEVRALGIGQVLLASALDQAWNNGLYRVQLDVYADNAPAIGLYRKFGFVDEGIRKHAHCRDGCYRDVLCMALLNGDAVAGEEPVPLARAASA